MKKIWTYKQQNNVGKITSMVVSDKSIPLIIIIVVIIIAELYMYDYDYVIIN